MTTQTHVSKIHITPVNMENNVWTMYVVKDICNCNLRQQNRNIQSKQYIQ